MSALPGDEVERLRAEVATLRTALADAHRPHMEASAVARAAGWDDGYATAVARVEALVSKALNAKPYPSTVSPYELRDALGKVGQ